MHKHQSETKNLPIFLLIWIYLFHKDFSIRQMGGGWRDGERTNLKEWKKPIHWFHAQYAWQVLICKKWKLHLDRDQQEEV